MKFVAPVVRLQAFNCPHCRVIARQYWWGYPGEKDAGPLNESQIQVNQVNADVKIKVSLCEHCGEVCLWHSDRLVFPLQSSAPPANVSMPDAVRRDYDEAAQILPHSPRGAAALLRLATQKLCVFLDQPGQNLNDDIAALVKQGLPAQVQQALDVVRVTGNNAVHPGQIDVDDAGIAGKLFSLVNIVVEYLIAMPSEVQTLYDQLPESAKKAVSNRDDSSQ